MGKANSYQEKLDQMEGATLLPLLASPDTETVRRLAVEYQFTFQELRQVAQAARDLEMWAEEPLADWWSNAERKTGGGGRERKKALIRGLDRHLQELAAQEKDYPEQPLAGQSPRQIRLVESDSARQVFGRCAAHSEKTVCCGLHTIDAVMGCAFRCSYCTIQTFYGDEAELATDLAGKLEKIELDPERFYHIGTGQASDSLLWGNRHGMLDALCAFAARNPNILLELKTKSDNIQDLLGRELPRNLVCSWSLNTETVIRNEEHGTASLERRLGAARSLADRGHRVAFHFHPMVHYRGWQEEYGAAADRLKQEFSPTEVAFLSMGSMTFIRPVARQIRRRGGETKVLQMEMTEDPHGKLTYSNEVKIQLYSSLYDRLRPWNEEVFCYLCMETATVWQAVLGRSYATNELFERDFARHTGFIS
jgi:spore photoproduct lyase